MGGAGTYELPWEGDTAIYNLLLNREASKGRPNSEAFLTLPEHCALGMEF